MRYKPVISIRLVFMLNVTLCPWPIDGFFLHQESKERLWLVRERNGVAIPTRGVCPLLTAHSPTYPTVGGVVAHEMKTLSCVGTVVRFRIALGRPSSRSRLPNSILWRAHLGPHNDLGFPWVGGVLWVAHSASSGSAWYAFFVLV